MTVENLLFLIPLLPFTTFLVNGIFGNRLPRAAVTAVACAAPAMAAVLAGAAFYQVSGQEEGFRLTSTPWQWIEVGDLRVPFGFALDRLGGVMALVVTGVGTLIHVYSAGYMRNDPGYARYFAYLNLFMAAMLVLVLADNIVLLFLGWEGVGLCSYLLIGFWYKDLANCNAGIKAFVVNRIGDFGFLLGILLIFVTFGTFGFESLDAKIAAGAAGNGTALFWIAILLFTGATGKSAQIPLYVWLPDAMAGPTPVSALIHAATMVTSGVYMVARMHVLYNAAPAVLALIAVLGVLTALLAALIALTQTDIKKVLAYSTVSQLGYMFFAAGMGAYAVALFHLVTHAFFKALLFLGAGAVIHALHHEQDMRRMGGLWKRIPLTACVFIAGALALAGFPLTAGFFSKDEILHHALARSFHEGSFHSLGWFVLWLLGFMTAILTAFYIFRQVILVFFGEYRGGGKEASAHGHAPGTEEIHEPPLSMMAPLAILALLSLGGGFLVVPELLAAALPGAGRAAPEEGKVLGWLLGGFASIAGMTAAYFLFLKAPGLRSHLAEGTSFGRAFTRLSFNKFYVDEVYDLIILKPFRILSLVLYYVVDRALIDWLAVRGTALFVRGLGGVLRKLQTGKVASYAMWFMGGTIGVLILVFLYLA